MTFNGDSFDFKFIHQRCIQLNIDWDSLGFTCSESTGRFGTRQSEYNHPCIVHVDCLRWVVRDSYLPQGSQGLKAVTKAKLKYSPMELSPEDMTPFARKRPQVLAQYSVSDAVATYFLYRKFIESFIFALCTIIPLPPDQVLRKGTGTLCECLLMVEASSVQLVYPDKIGGQGLRLHYIDREDASHADIARAIEQNPCGCNNPGVRRPEERLLDVEELQFGAITRVQPPRHSRTAVQRVLASQTYAGGRVEALNAGIYHADFEYAFAGHPDAAGGYAQLLGTLREDLEFCVYQKYKECVDAVAVEK